MEIPEVLRNKLNQAPNPPIDEAKKFLRRYWGDESMLDAIRVQIEDTISFNPNPVIRGLVAIETLLATSLPDGTLLDIVLWDANYPLDDPSEQSARIWLQEIVEFVRDVLGDQQPPKQPPPSSVV